jgi:uncharacterized protein YndB with AHSA1/START domain
MFDILHRVGIRTSQDKVYKALATAEGVSRWWTTETTGDDKAGGKLRFRFTDHGRELGVFNMNILDLDAGSRVAWQVIDGPEEWVGTKISFDLRQDGDFTIVLFKHEGWKEPVEFMYHCSTKWAIFLMSLKSLGETGKGQPSPDDVKVGDWH